MRYIYLLVLILFSFDSYSITDEDLDKLKLQIDECYLDNVSNTSISLDDMKSDNYDKFFTFKILVNEDKSIKELIYDGRNKEFSDFLNETFDSPECNELTLPDGFYEEWKEINFSFDFSSQLIQEKNKKIIGNLDIEGCRIKENLLSKCLEKYCLKNDSFFLEEINNCKHNPDVVINETQIDSFKDDFNKFLFRNPLKAIKVSEEIKRYNLYVFDMASNLLTNGMCLEADVDNFDSDEFLNDNKLEDNNSNYDINFFIEDIHNGKFNLKDQKLKALQYFCKKGVGGGSEKQWTIKFLYKSWKGEVNKRFEFCNYITSGLASAICTNRKIKEKKVSEQEDFNTFKSKFDDEIAASIDELYSKASKYFSEVASKETYKSDFTLRQTYIMNDKRERELQLNKILQSNGQVFQENVMVSNKELQKIFEDILNSFEIFGIESDDSRYLNSTFDKKYKDIFYRTVLEDTQNSFYSYKELLISVLLTVKPNIKSAIIENNLNYNRKNELYSVHSLLTQQYFDKEDNPYCDWAETQEEKYNGCFIYKDENQYYIESSFGEAYSKSKQNGYNYFWWNEEIYSTE